MCLKVTPDRRKILGFQIILPKTRRRKVLVHQTNSAPVKDEGANATKHGRNGPCGCVLRK